MRRLALRCCVSVTQRVFHPTAVCAPHPIWPYTVPRQSLSSGRQSLSRTTVFVVGDTISRFRWTQVIKT